MPNFNNNYTQSPQDNQNNNHSNSQQIRIGTLSFAMFPLLVWQKWFWVLKRCLKPSQLELLMMLYTWETDYGCTPYESKLAKQLDISKYSISTRINELAGNGERLSSTGRRKKNPNPTLLNCPVCEYKSPVIVITGKDHTNRNCYDLTPVESFCKHLDECYSINFDDWVGYENDSKIDYSERFR